MKTQDKTLRLFDALKNKLSAQDFASVLTNARLTDRDFEALEAEIESQDQIENCIDLIKEESLEPEQSNDLVKFLFSELTTAQKHEIAKDYISNLWVKSSGDKILMNELHEMLECDLDTKEPLNVKIYNLKDTLGSVLDELEKEAPDLTKIKKWINNDLKDA